MATCKVFYSWQSDLPNPTNRRLIGTALENAVRSIHNDDSIEVEPVVDRDTSGVPGSPDIASTIFAKIEQAQVFVCDISIINPESLTRLTPNPNVLIELGYAVKTLGSERVILVMNVAFGGPENLPFDLRMRRVITYSVSPDAQEKAPERRQLEGKLQAALSAIFTDQEYEEAGEVIQPVSIGDQARAAVENTQPNQNSLTRKFMSNLVGQLDSIAPDFRNTVSDQDIVDALENSIEMTIEFSRTAEVIASMNAADAAMIIYKGFEDIISRYYTPTGFEGTFYRLAFDFYKFIGHEWLVILFSFLIREECWEVITHLLDEEFYVERIYETDKSGTVPFTYTCQNLRSLIDHNERLKLNKISIHSDLLNNRHTQGELADLVPMQQFINADAFLLLRSELSKTEVNSFLGWRAWSLLYTQRSPKYLIEAYRVKNAEKLLVPLQVSDVETLRERMIEVIPKLSKMFGSNLFHVYPPLGEFDPQKIGSRP